MAYTNDKPIYELIYEPRIVGRLTQDPGGSDKVAWFGVAYQLRYKDAAENRFVDGPTTFFNVKTFDAEVIKFAKTLRKGDVVDLHGRMQCSEYTSKTTGEVKTSEVIVIDPQRHSTHYLQAAEPKQVGASAGSKRTPAPSKQRPVAADDGSEIPF